MNIMNYVVQSQRTYIHGKEAKLVYYGVRVIKIYVYK